MRSREGKTRQTGSEGREGGLKEESLFLPLSPLPHHLRLAPVTDVGRIGSLGLTAAPAASRRGHVTSIKPP